MSLALAALQQLVDEIAEGGPADRALWIERGRAYLENLYGEDSSKVERFTVMAQPSVVMSDQTISSGEFEAAQQEAIAEAAAMLRATLESQQLDSGMAIAEVSPVSDAAAIFLVQGRDLVNNDAMKQFLRSLGLRVIEWEEARAATNDANAYTGDIVDAGIEMAAAVVVLLTADDEAMLRSDLADDSDSAEERAIRKQPRPNVIYEAGIAMGIMKRQTVFVRMEGVSLHSDIVGRHIPTFDGSLAARKNLVDRLKVVGLDVRDTGTDWHTAGAFVSVASAISAERDQSEDGEEITENDSHDDAATDVAQLGTLELVANMEDALPAIGSSIERMGTGANEMAELMVDATEKVQRGSTSAKERLAIVIKLAKQIEPHADETERLAIDFSHQVDAVDRGLGVLFDQIESGEADIEPAEAAELLVSTIDAADSVETLSATIGGTMDNLVEIGSLARPLRRETERIRGAYRLYREEMRVIEGWGDRARQIRDALE